MGTARKVSPLLGESTAIEELRDFIVGVSLRQDPVLLTGDSGTGKGLAARKIHAVGGSARAPFARVSCERFTESELDRLLFGAKRGVDDGLLRSSGRSTCYVAGLEYLPPAITDRMSEFLLERSGDQTRLVFSSRFRLEELMEATVYQRDFLELISTYHKRIPPLRERIEDIPILSNYQVWLQSSGEDFEALWDAFEEELLHEMLTYPWPGNVRELNQFIRAFVGLEAAPGAEGELQEGEIPALFLRRAFEELYEELQENLTLEGVSQRHDLVLPASTRESGFDEE